MEVTLAVLADAANVSREGKLNILGIFDTIYAMSFPLVHPRMELVIRLECGSSEFGSNRPVKVLLLDADGNRKGEIGGMVQVAAAQPGPRLQMDSTIPLVNTPFEQPGDYALSILVGDDEKKSVRLHVVHREQEVHNAGSVEGEDDQG